MNTKNYVVPKQIIDAKEEKSLITLTDTYNKMIEPSIASKALSKVGDKIPQPIKDFTNAAKEKLTDSELIIKSLELLGKSFQTLEQFAAKVTLSEKDIIKMVNPIVVDNEITSLDEICLARGYDISKLVGKAKFVDIIATLIEGGVTGYAGFVGLPFNLVASTFLFYRAVQSTALFYGYDIKNDPAELQIASEVFMNAMSPKNNNDSELSSAIAKVMLLTTTTSVKQTVKKGWTAMAEKGGVHLLITQMRALANSAAKKALEKAGKKGLEKTVFSEVFEQLGKKLTQKSIGKAIPKIGAFIGATIDTAQMVQILKYADVFYNKRFLLEKESRIDLLCAQPSTITTEEYDIVDNDDFVYNVKANNDMIEFICYPKCTTCQKAKKWLDDNKIEYELRDIKEDNPSLEELTAWYKMSGLPLKKFFNTSGLLYKSMELKDKLPTMSDEEQLKLLATDGMLVKRPLVVGKDFVLVGFKESEWNEKL